MPLPDELVGAPIRERGRCFEDMHVGDRFDHHWGRTITETDVVLFSSLTLAYQPSTFNAVYAESVGMTDVVPAALVLGVVFGLSVEDLSERGGAFLGIDDLRYHRPVRIGETLTSHSEVLEVRESSSRPTQGIVTWRTVGMTAGDAPEAVISFTRTNLIMRRSPA
jgi:itaconyl-CoA hydratase